MEEKDLQARLKNIKKWGKNDGKRYVIKEKEKGELTADDFYNQCRKVYNNRERMKTQFNYTEAQIDIMLEVYHEAYWSGVKWWENRMVQISVIMAKYKPIFDKAEKVAKEIDVSDIKDGFPCGGAIIYLKPEAKSTDLGKALRSLYGGDSYSSKVCHQWAYELPIKMPSYGQCVDYGKRVCNAVADFLNSKDVPTEVYSYID